MRYLLFLLLLAGCTTQKVIISQELPDRVIYKVPGKWVWGSIVKDKYYQDYFPYNYGRQLQPGDLVIYDWRRHRFKEVAVQPICRGDKEGWLILNYPGLEGGYKCGCR